MATLASATSGHAVLMLGAGEVKQTKPYGHPRRAEGLPRMEDILRIFQLFWERHEPFDFDGNVWKMENAWLGATKTHRPKIWLLGAGPKLLDLATSYADGLRTLVPCAGSVEAYAAQVLELKQQLESKGRDPDDFTFAIGPALFLHDDPDVLAHFKRKLLVRWQAAIFGRLNRTDWEREGVATPPEFQVDWHYALKLLPYQLTRQEAENMAATATDEMVDGGIYFGSPKEVAATLQEFIDAGANCVTTFFDQSTLFLEPEEHDASTKRLIEMSRLIKDANP
jgi:phthiodiolone/phenolphthiodiolone dimycocerosates ketoreductase